MKVEALKRPLTIDLVRDGGAYRLPRTKLTPTNLFLRIGELDELFIKVPSERGLDDYRKYVKLAQTTPADIRTLEDAERFERLEQTLDQVGLTEVARIGAETAHYLAVHKIQYTRLQSQSAVGIPRAKFAVLGSALMGIFRRFEPVLFQERIHGVTLWDMYDFSTLRVIARYQPYLPAISTQLSALLDSGLLNHVDWNIQNFVFDEAQLRLFYVDLKPTTFVAKQSNEHNLKGIRDYFLA